MEEISSKGYKHDPAMKNDADYKEYETLVSKGNNTDEEYKKIGQLANKLIDKYGAVPGGESVRRGEVEYGEDYPFSDEENEEIYTSMYESGDPDYTDFYLKKHPEMRNKEGDIDYKYSTPELGKEYMKQHPELWKQTREWLDTNKEVEEREEKKFQEQLKKLKNQADTNDNGKIEEDEMADFQKSLDDYAAKNKKGREDIPVTTRRR